MKFHHCSRTETLREHSESTRFQCVGDSMVNGFAFIAPAHSRFPGLGMRPLATRKDELSQRLEKRWFHVRFTTCKLREHMNTTDPRLDRWAPENFGFLHVATITGAHGVKGELKARTEGDFNRVRLSVKKNAQQRYLLLPGRRYPRPVNLSAGREASQLNAWILRLDGFHTRESINKLRGARLYVRESDRPSLERGEFMVSDLIGSRVLLLLHADDKEPWYTDEGSGQSTAIRASNPIGIVDSVITRRDICEASGSGASGASVASDVIEIALFELPEQHVHSGFHYETPPDSARRVLIPFVDEIVPLVDINCAVIVLNPPEGLLDIAVVKRKKKERTPRALLMPANQNTVMNANEV